MRIDIDHIGSGPVPDTADIQKLIDDLWTDVRAAHGITADTFSPPLATTVSVGPLDFRVLDWGGTGEPVVFIHGAGDNASIWDLTCELMRARGFRCLAFDLRNHGKSSRVASDGRPLDARGAALDIGPVIKALGLVRPVIVGHSMGGLAALYWLIDHPEDCRALVCVDITPTPSRAGLAKTRDYLAKEEWPSWKEALEDATAMTPYRPRAQVAISLLLSLTPQRDGTWRRASRGSRSMTFRPSASELRALSSPDARPYADMTTRLDRLSLPILVAFGQQSETTTIDHVANFVDQLPNARAVCISEAGHAVHRDKPKPLADAISGFLADVH